MKDSLLYDTGILIYIVRDTSTNENVRKTVNPDGWKECISVVNKAEALSIANRNNWGKSKVLKLNKLFQGITIVDISDDLIIDKYVEIDVYSPRNMGKNDL
jgi:tRNA(fMet)-specific endonuclease VapC